MAALVITPVYVALTALLMVVLASRVARLRGKLRVSLGDGGSDLITVASRGFGNLTEYAPVVLLLLLMMEIGGVPALWLHIYGSIFIFFRVLHPLSLMQGGAPKWKRISRVISAAGTAVLLVIGAVVLLLM